MKKLIFLAFLILALNSCEEKAVKINVNSFIEKYEGTPNEVIHSNNLTFVEKIGWLTRPATFQRCNVEFFKDMKFIIGHVDEDNDDSEINYISTDDKHYITSENVKVGLTLKEVKQLVPNIKVFNFPPLGCSMAKLPSKWIVHFNPYEGEVPNDSIKVIYFSYNVD